MSEKNYYDNGKLKSEFEKNDNGKLDGIYREYYENGQLKLECTYKDGQLDGISKEYYKNNQLSCEYNFKNGQLDGLCKEYYDSGKIKEEYYCKNGEFEGIYKKYYTNGKEKSEYNYKNGRISGIAKEYRINGDTDVEYDYKKINLENIYKKYEVKKNIAETAINTNISPNINESLEVEKEKIRVSKNTENLIPTKEILKEDNASNDSRKKDNVIISIIVATFIGVLALGVFLYFILFKAGSDYQDISSQEKISYSQQQNQQEEVKTTVVENNNINTYIPTVEDARYVNYKTYYNDNFDYSIDYPDDEYFQISKTYEDGMKLQNDNGEVLISLTSNWNPNGESLQQAYDKAVREKPNAAYKFLGKTFFTITYEDNGLLIFRKTMYDKNTNKYVYLYVSFPPEYKDYMTPIVERMANSMKKSVSNVTSTANNSYSDSQLENKFGRVVKDKYVGGSFIEFLRNADENEYYYLRDQFWEILNTMYVTEGNKTYYYLNDIIDQLETKADWDNSSRVISLEVKGNKMYYTVGFPKGYNANTPSWVQFEIFERKFNDGIGLRTAHVSCAINGVEYKDWDAVYTIFR
ncbi:toxin-antitoxin system YwqK family antitoxin [Fusobacterium pseudoperiodonticum]|uniref:toxin-antitoxin system YwqK family antitoxin n=1 Tax=Fusobacterium pseudoperiodonticum TaxID=2663009 RepID=UPI0028ECAFAE|nr:toxin-antitoxin system YwqK family antitoxin [Fusobacterium pseudoperiodonticum]